MNAELKTATAKRKIISLPFLLIAIVLVVGGYPASKWVMEKVMTMQEQGKASLEAIPPEAGTVDKPGTPGAAAGRTGGGGRGQQGGGGEGGGNDPAAFFDGRDADKNGKLEGEEINERMQSRVEAMDTDKDGAISKEEFLAGRANRDED